MADLIATTLAEVASFTSASVVAIRSAISSYLLAAWSETRQVRMGQLALMHMQAAQFGATMQMREYLARIQQVPGIKGAFQPLLLFQVILGELNGHEVTLFHTDTMFTGQHTTHFNAASQDIGTKILSAFQLTRDIGIKQD